MDMRGAVRGGALLAGWLATAAIGVAQQHTNFVSCPIVRDTASVPCWLAEYGGELYFLTLQTDVSAPVTPPWLGHRVLVEGTVSAEPRICGGIVLKPVHLSVLDRDASCTTMLPAEERYNLTFEPPRPPGPSNGRLAFDNAPAAPPSPRAVSTREFVVSYSFDGLIACYIAAIPFFQNSLLGTLVYAALLFGGFELVRRRMPGLRAATV